MEEEKINLAGFEFNVDDVIAGMQELATEIKRVGDSQRELKKTNNTTSKVYIEQEVELSALRKEYNLFKKALSDTQKELQETETRHARMDIVLNQEVKTIAQARAQNKELNKLRNTTNLTTAEGIAEVEKLNNALDANNAFIKDNVDAYTQQKINIGNYKDSITEALSELNLFEGGLGGIQQNYLTIIQSSNEAGGAMSFFSGGLKQAKAGMIALTKSALAFLATPIGAVVGLIGAAFLLVQNAVNRSEKSTNKLKRAFAPLSDVFSKVLDALEPLGEILIDGIVAGFELAEEAAISAIKIFGAMASTLGFDDLAESAMEFADSVEVSIKSSKELADQEARLTEEKRRFGEVTKRFIQQQELERQTRDDVTLSIGERIEANNRLGAVLDAQSKEQMRIANLELAVIDNLIEKEGERTELLERRSGVLEEIQKVFCLVR